MSNVLLLVKCGQGSTDDELSPTCVTSLLGIRIEGVAAGLWHTVCISADGDVYAFGGNQFGQLGTGADQAEVHIKFICNLVSPFHFPNRTEICFYATNLDSTKRYVTVV